MSTQTTETNHARCGKLYEDYGETYHCRRAPGHEGECGWNDPPTTALTSNPAGLVKLFWDSVTHNLRETPTRHGWHTELYRAKDVDAEISRLQNQRVTADTEAVAGLKLCEHVWTHQTADIWCCENCGIFQRRAEKTSETPA